MTGDLLRHFTILNVLLKYIMMIWWKMANERDARTYHSLSLTLHYCNFTIEMHKTN